MNCQITPVLALLFLGGVVQADTVTVTQTNLSFSPQHVTISVGDTLRWVHTGGQHDVTEGNDGSVDGDEAFFGFLDTASTSFEVVFDAAFLSANPRPGNVYDYFCSPHFAIGMTGSITVENIVLVQQSGTSFSPRDLVIELGQTVRWLHGGGNHTVTEGTDGSINGNEAFHSNLNTGTTTYEVLFDAAFLAANPRTDDRYDYFCAPHFAFGMTGSVTVASSEPGSAYCFGDGSGTACPCSNSGGAGEGCANDTGVGAIFSATGSASIGADDLVLNATQLTPGPGLFFQGNNAVNSGNGNPFGDGLRCAGGSVIRLEVRFSNSGNGFTTESTVSIATQGGVSAGQTKRYQFWHRDAGTSPCSSLFNLTNGYEITWGA